MRHPTTTVPRRNIPLLAALAILGVVLNHATWQILGDIAPGEPRGYPYMPLDQAGKFAIPAFMFIAGYFTAYATSGGRTPLAWSVVRARIARLFWPWVLWSSIWMSGQALTGRAALTPRLAFEALFSQYYFIPMLMVYYLLAPLVVTVARRNIRILMLSVGLLQAAGVALFYVQVHTPLLNGLIPDWVDLIPLQYLRFAIYFPFGLAVGMKPSAFAPLLRWRRALPWLTLLAFGLSNLEGLLVYRSRGGAWPHADSHVKATSLLFSLGVLFCFMVYEHIPTPQRMSKSIRSLSANTYGIYLSHYVVVGLLDRAAAPLLPASLSPLAGWGYILTLTALTLALCLGMIQFSTRFKKARILLFG